MCAVECDAADLENEIARCLEGDVVAVVGNQMAGDGLQDCFRTAFSTLEISVNSRVPVYSVIRTNIPAISRMRASL